MFLPASIAPCPSSNSYKRNICNLFVETIPFSLVGNINNDKTLAKKKKKKIGKRKTFINYLIAQPEIHFLSTLLIAINCQLVKYRQFRDTISYVNPFCVDCDLMSTHSASDTSRSVPAKNSHDRGKKMILRKPRQADEIPISSINCAAMQRVISRTIVLGKLFA